MSLVSSTIPRGWQGLAAAGLAASVLVACGGLTAEAPLTVKLGATRDQATTQLRAHKYCHHADGPAPKVETYPRCDRPGTEWGESWVTAQFDHDALVELKRYERFTDDNRAVERWNQLIADRVKLSPEAPDAGPELSARTVLPAGTRSVKAWRLDASTVVGVYLLTPTPPESASVLEAILRLPAAPQ